MNLHITELDTLLKHVRLAPRSGVQESNALSNMSPQFCACANRYGVGPAAVAGNAEQRGGRDHSRATFARLGR